MIKQVQELGKKKWFAEHFLAIQNEGWKVMEGLLSQYATSCIWSGCAVTVNGGDATKYDIAPGIVFMKDAGGVYQFAAFAGVTAVDLPGYITLNTAATSALYGDGDVKNIYITTSGAYDTAAPGAGIDYLHITNTTPTTWKDVVGISNPVAAPESFRVVGALGQPAFGTDFTVPGGRYAKFRKDGLGFVEVNFQVQHAGSSAVGVVFTLPAGYRPPINVTFIYSNNAVTGLGYVNTDGTVNVALNGGGGAIQQQGYIIFRT